MDLWRALKIGLTVRVFFPAKAHVGSVTGEYVTMKITGVGPDGILTPDTTVTGVITEQPQVNVGFNRGDKVAVSASQIEEILP